MKKEYVKPQNRVVVLKDRLLQIGETSIGEGEPYDAKQNGINSSNDDTDGYSDDVWED